MSRKAVRNLTLIVATVVALGLAGGWWWLAIGRWPLAGDLSHDFGVVPVAAGGSSFEHTFALRNRTSRPIVIEKIVPGCGCTSAEASTREVAPGETVDIDVTLSLARAGRKRTNVALVLQNWGVQSLWVQGVGKKDASLIVSETTLTLTRGEPSALVIFYDRQTTADQPDQPVCRVPDGVDVTPVRWEPVRAEATMEKPARWRGMLKVTLPDDVELPPNAEMLIALPPAGSATVRLVERVLMPPVGE